MSDDLYTLVGYQVEATADWRRRQAEYFPSNDRNRRAAKELERLAAEIAQLEGSSVHEQIRLASDRLENEDWFAMSESVYAELPEIGISKALVAQSMVTGALRPVPEHIVVRFRQRRR